MQENFSNGTDFSNWKTTDTNNLTLKFKKEVVGENLMKL